MNLPNPQVLTPTEWQALDSQVRADAARRSFRTFMAGFYKVLEPHTNYKENILTAAICEHLEAVSKGQIKRLLISAPPQHGKSKIASVAWTLWDWLDNSHRKFLNVSFKMSLAESFSEDAAKVFKSDWYQQNFAIPRNLTLVKDTIEYFENSAGGSRRSTAFESATGFGVAGGVLVVDDPHPVSVSDEVRQQQLDQFNRGLSNRAGATGSIVILGQRVHTNDLIGSLMNNEEYEHVCLPNEYDPKRSKVTVIGWKDPRTEENELLWPEVFDERRTKEAKRYGLTHYEGQYNQSPVRKGGNIFDRSNFRSYTAETLPQRKDRHATVITLDCSFNDTKKSDYVVCQCWTRAGANFYLLDQIRKQANFPDTVKLFLAMCNSHPEARGKYIEQGANGFAIIETLKNRISGIIPIKTGNASKVSRYEAVAPLIEAQNVYLPKHAEWLEEFLLEAESVPASRHDDQMDAMAMALHQLEGCIPFTDVFGTFEFI